MMISKLRLTMLILCAVGIAAMASGKDGDCEERAVTLKFSSAGGYRDVTLLPEYDYDSDADKEADKYDSNQGVYYFKAKLERGYSYTIWTDGIGTNDNITVTTYAAESDDDEKDGPDADFDEIEEPGADQRLVLYADEWDFGDGTADDPGDPKSWTYYFEVSGDVGDSIRLYYQQGVVIPEGREDNPKVLYPSTSAQKLSNKKLQTNNEYYLRAKLQAGRMYWFGTEGGSADCVLNLFIEGEDPSNEDQEAPECTLIDDPDYETSDYDVGYYVIPSETAFYSIVVSGESDDESGEEGGDGASSSGAPFSLSYRMLASRAIQDHAATELNEANSFTADCVAGGMNPAASVTNGVNGIYDAIIDESLFVFTAEKGGRYVVETEGASTNLLMRIYDSKGNILCENEGDGRTLNARCAFEAAAAAAHYVGVCQKLEDEIWDEPAYTHVTLKVMRAESAPGDLDEWDASDGAAAGASPLSPLPGAEDAAPETVDEAGHGWHTLGRSDWADVFAIAARKDVVYSLRVSLEDPAGAFNSLAAEVFTLAGTTERSVAATGDVNAGSVEPLTFTATSSAMLYVRLSVAEGKGLDYPKYKIHASARAASGEPLGVLTVNTPGAPGATWSVGSETVKYPGGSSILAGGSVTVKMSSVAGYKASAASTNVVVAAGTTPTVVDVYYSDTFDPKDDVPSGATNLSLKNVDTEYAKRTLWPNDPGDCFAIAGADGYLYDIALRGVEGDGASFSITNAENGVVAENRPSVVQLPLPKTKSKYYLVVKNGAGATSFGGYTLAGKFANVGAIKFAKTSLSVKENAAAAVLTVNRTAKDGQVRVKYATVAGTAKPGVDYVEQSGVLEWTSGDNKAKTISVKLIPDLVPVYDGNKTFSVRLEPAETVSDGEYPALIVGGDECVVTLTEVSKAGTTEADAYAKYVPKPATVKTETVALETGTFYGVLAETADGESLTNGFPRLASVTFTASTASPAALSAKVALAGKTYSFSAKGWDESGDDASRSKTFSLVQKVNGVTYTNTLSVAVAAGATGTDGDWLRAGGTAELVMNVPDANNKGAQTGIVYRGDIYRNNAKIQDYLNAVTNFAGYYTVALVTGASAGDGVPAGNGYLTLTIDSKGTAKAAGILADGATKPSLSVAACSLRKDGGSANGYSMRVPLFFAKSPCCFGGTLRLYAAADGKVVVDSSDALVWNNDNRALTYGNETGYRLAPAPVGGWYDKVVNLQAYYLGREFDVDTIAVDGFPKEALTDGYAYSTVQPRGTEVDLTGDVFSVAKQALVKDGKLNNLAASVNPCNVQVKLARATGIVTGTFALWSETGDGSAQKQITGIKHNGVLLLSRDAASPLPDDVLTAGFFTQPVKLPGRTWTFSAPFNILGAESE